MDNQDLVSREELEEIVTALTLQTQLLSETLGVVIAMMCSKLGVTEQEVRETMAQAARSGTGQKLKEAREKLHSSEAIRNVLRTFQGPLQ
jgi:alkylhydroperoxidase/carboxymuconolactone decarboxylase family protein YurZ